MLNVLLIAYAFPPIPYAGTYRSLRLCKELDSKAIKLHVLTINVYKDIPNDFNLLKKIPVSVKIHRAPILDPWRKYQIWKNKLNKLPGYKYLNKLFSLLLRPLTVPDHMVLWNFSAVPAAMKIIKKHNIAMVIVTSPPNSTLFIGYILKKFLKIKWIADLRDPIIGNVFEVEFNERNDILTKIERNIRKLLRKLVVKKSDMVITTTETHRNQLIKDFKQNEIITIYNSFDEDNFSTPQNLSYDSFTISHMGSIIGLRRIDVFLKAIKLLEKHIEPDILKLQVLFYGMHGSHLGNDIRRFKVENYCKIKNIVPHYQAIEIIRASHLLLLLKAKGPGALDHIPAKLFEYIGARRKILCIGSEKSEAAMIIDNQKIGYTVEDDVNKIFQILKKEYLQFLLGSNKEIESIDTLKFSSKTMARKFMNAINYVNAK
jgi:glycosyltransferase involved in cell wall biosynthesis